MPEITSSLAPISQPPPFSTNRPNAATAKFLGMIPRKLTSSPALQVESYSKPFTAKRTANALIASLEVSESGFLKQETETIRSFKAPQTVLGVLAIPTVVLKGKTITERADAIIQTAEDCGRLHSERAKRLYHFLVMAALAEHMALRPEVKVTPNRMTLFFVADELPLLLGVCRATIYRAFDDLTAGGLVARRSWFTSSRLVGNGKKGTVTGGVVAEVVLTPAQGTVAFVRAEHLRKSYRNLDADRHAGRTSWQWMTEVKESHVQARALEAEATALPQDATTIQKIKLLNEKATNLRQSILSNEIEKKLQHFLRWTLFLPNSDPVLLTVSARQEAVYRLGDLTIASPQQRGTMIQERAEALRLAVGDNEQSLRFWRWLLWRISVIEHVQPGCISAMTAALMRLLTDIQEWSDDRVKRPLKCAGALFVSRLKSSGWWDELKEKI